MMQQKGTMNVPGRRMILAVTLSFLVASAYAANVDSKAEDTATIEERLSRLEEEVRLLRSQLEAEKKANAEKAEAQALLVGKASTGPIITADAKDGFSISSNDKDFVLRFRGLFQADGRAVSGKAGSVSDDTFLLRRVRPSFEGTVWKYIDFRFVPDFGGGSSQIQDAFLDLKYFPFAKVKVGRFKSPFGIERLQSSGDTLFTELALPGNLTPNYDIGVVLHGELLLDGRLSYALGMLNGAADNASIDSDIDSNKEIAARVFVNPFKGGDSPLLEGLGVGFATTLGNPEGTSSSSYLPAYKTTGQQTFFSYRSGAAADGDHVRYSPQAYYSYGSFGLLAEYITACQDVTLGGASATMRNKGWQFAASYVITGEAATYGTVVPEEPFDPASGRWGAVELVGRVSEIDIDDDAFPTFANPDTAASKAMAWGAGINWFLNRNVKWQFDYETTTFEGGRTGGRDRQDERSLMTRLQLAF